MYPLSRYADAFLTALRNRARGTPTLPRASSSRRYQTTSRPSKYRISWYELDTTIAFFTCRSIPILALVDGDAFGLDILSVYRFGSARMQHEREGLAAARIRWLGLRTSELSGYVQLFLARRPAALGLRELGS